MTWRYFVLILVIILSDQITKSLVSYRNSFTKLNFGLSFGLFPKELAFFLSLSACIFLGVMAIFMARKSFIRHKRLALTLLLSGGISNVVDRFRFGGAVADWIPFFGIFTFNIADAAISLGVILLLYDNLPTDSFRR